MPVPTLRRRRGLLPGRGISSLAEAPADPHRKVLHLCRYPRNAAPFAVGTVNGAGIPPAARPGDHRGPLPGRPGDPRATSAAAPGLCLRLLQGQGRPDRAGRRHRRLRADARGGRRPGHRARLPQRSADRRLGPERVDRREWPAPWLRQRWARVAELPAPFRRRLHSAFCTVNGRRLRDPEASRGQSVAWGIGRCGAAGPSPLGRGAGARGRRWG
jgi:hypothetical protein